MTRYVGTCFDSGRWGGDLSGLLLAERPTGWVVMAGHISSSEEWASQDIERHYEKTAVAGDTFEWAGRLTYEEIEARFPLVPE